MTIQTLRDESKRVVRDPIAKVIITWTDPLIDLSIEAETSENNRVSYPVQVADLITDVPRKWFHTNDTSVILDGSHYPAPSTLKEARNSQMGWWGTQSGDGSGGYLLPPQIAVTFTRRLVEGVTVTGDSAMGEYPEDYTVNLYITTGGEFVKVDTIVVSGNTEVSRYDQFSGSQSSATKIELVITKWSAPGKIVKIAEFYSSIVEEFDASDIMQLNILQEFEAAEGTLPIGNISCNELDLSLQNITDRFFSENTNSDIYTFIRRNRKIEPFIGFRYKNGDEELLPLGLYWSGDWLTADNSTTAQTSARDRFELMRKKDFLYDEVFTGELFDVSVKYLLEQVLESLFPYMYDLYYDISDVDDTYLVPYFDPEFFKGKNYFEVIKDLAIAGLMYVYMDTPTELEKAENGLLCKDFFRAQRLETVFPQTLDPATAIQVTKRDFIDKSQVADTESMANTVKVVYKEFTFVDDSWESEDKDYTESDADSISDYGVMNYEYETSDLIQEESHAIIIANSLLASFKIPKRDIEINSFGDITLELADQISVPEYQKNGIDKRGIFAITKLNPQFDGSLRMVVSGRKLADDNSGVLNEGRGLLAQPSIDGLSGVMSFPATGAVSGYDVEPFTIGREADTYVVPDGPPIITVQPVDTLAVDGVATFNLTATGDEPLSYQWYDRVLPASFAPIVGEVSDTLLVDVFSESLEFDGANDSVEFQPVQFDSIRMLVRPNLQETDYGYLYDGRGDGGAGYLIVEPIQIGSKWLFGGGLRVFVDGVEISSGVDVVQNGVVQEVEILTNAGTAPVSAFGRRFTNSDYFRGILYSYSAFNGATSVLVYDMEGQFGNATLLDSSGNGNDGTINGATWIEGYNYDTEYQCNVSNPYGAVDSNIVKVIEP